MLFYSFQPFCPGRIHGTGRCLGESTKNSIWDQPKIPLLGVGIRPFIPQLRHIPKLWGLPKKIETAALVVKGRRQLPEQIIQSLI